MERSNVPRARAWGTQRTLETQRTCLPGAAIRDKTQPRQEKLPERKREIFYSFFPLISGLSPEPPMGLTSWEPAGQGHQEQKHTGVACTPLILSRAEE